MCGIFGYVSDDSVTAETIVRGLEKMEYRGYDSAGVGILRNNKLVVRKKKGKVSNLRQTGISDDKAVIGIGHTRWATHGVPHVINAHPHVNKDETIAVVHNGIIENYSELKTQLEKKGYSFQSETDSEVIVHLIDSIRKEFRYDILKSFRTAVRRLVGAYGICMIALDEPGKLFLARNGSPLIIGIGISDKVHYVASDVLAFAEYTDKIIYLEDHEMAVVGSDFYRVSSIGEIPEELPKEILKLDIDISQIEKAGYPFFMLKEIFEQSETYKNCIRGRVNARENTIKLGGIENDLPRILRAKRLLICACGTSWHAGLLGEYFLEKIARIPVEVDYASEFRYRDVPIDEEDVVILISQSGETADTLAALKKAKSKGAFTLGICNVVGSEVARISDCGIYTHAGHEIGVASTKAFTSQITSLMLFSLYIAQEKKLLSRDEFSSYLSNIENLPESIDKMLEQSEAVKAIAEEFREARNFLYLGRGMNFPVALEGALKLKEISYIHAEGYPAAEMKHGPIALIDENMPVVVISVKDHLYSKVLSNVEEIKARGGKIIVIASEADEEIKKYSDYIIRVPEVKEDFIPFLSNIPLQLLAYHIAVLKGKDVDKPRNLAKSVTVE